MRGLLTGVLFIFIICLHSFVHADRIVLNNGDRLTGTVEGIENGLLTLRTDYSKPIKIQVSKIRKIFTDKPVDVHLSEGEILKGKLNTLADGKMVIESSDEGEAAVFYWNKVKAINPPDKSKWTGDLTLSGNHQSGNTERIGASAGARASRKTEKDRFSLRFLYNYAEEDGEVSARNTYSALKYDYFFTEKTYGLIGIELLSDEFKDLNLRTVVGPGVGYQVCDKPDKSLGLEAGVSYFSEDRKEAEDDQWVTGRLAGDLRLKIFEPITLTDYLLIYPSFEDFGEYQLRNEAALASPLTSGWSLKLTNIIEHDSNPPVGIEKSDIYWLFGLAYNF
jgi:putative salt-induced outer membrane protein YdiY